MSEAEAHKSPFSPVILAWLIGAGVFAFAAFFVLSAYAPDLRRGNDGGGHALSKSAVGFAGAVKLLEARGTPVAVSRAGARAQSASLFIATPRTAIGRPALEALDDYVDAHEEPILVVLPKWETVPHPRRPGWVRRDGPTEALVALSPTFVFSGVRASLTRRAGRAPVRLEPAAVPPVPTYAARPPGGRTEQTGAKRLAPPSLLTGPVRDIQVLAGAGLEPVLTDRAGGTVLAYVRNRNTYVLSDPDLLNTQGLADPRTAGAALAILDLIRVGDGPVNFDVSLHGFGQSRSLLKLALSPPFLAATLCAVAVALLAGWQAAVRFGPSTRARRPFALGKQALADNAAALVKQSGREHRMARRYAELTQARAAHSLAAPPGDEAAVSAYLDGLNCDRPDSPRLSALLDEARSAGTREQLLAVARRLHQWRREVQREH